ncbi:hypothetical protein IKG24_00020 [Candidatus Saccharibacteria bacterium]|nr:hypothetical protein [Candidatus Saccharibacteria bacterium]
MKKSLIAAGAASVALAAMPIVGAFAADFGSVSDTVNVTISDGCTVTNSTTNRTVSVPSMTAGSAAQTADGAAISIVCNATGWTVSAAGATEGTNKNSLYSGTYEIPTGNTFSGSNSAWGLKVTASGATVATGYNDYTNVPGAAGATVATGSATSGSVTPSYKVFAAANQEAGAYSGKVVYTISLGA